MATNKYGNEARPRVTTADHVVSAKVGVKGEDFAFRYKRGRFRFRIAHEQSTGDGDASPVEEGGCLVYGAISMQGAMMAGHALGIAKMAAKASNPVEVEVFIAVNRKLKMKLLIHDIDIQHDPNSSKDYVGVSLLCTTTETDMADLENLVAA